MDLRRFPYFRARMAAAAGGLSYALPEDLPSEGVAERDALEQAGVRAFAAVPVRAGERELGYLAFVSRRGERVWTVDVMQQLQMLAEHFANALIQAESAAAVETSAAFTGAVLAALPGDVAILDGVGTIVQTNETWATMAKSAPPAVQLDLAVGGNYLDACRSAFGMPPDVAFKLQHSLLDVLHGGLEELALEYRASRDGIERWQEVRVRRLARHGGGAAIMHFDVTARRQAEAASQRHLGQLAHLDRVAGMGQLAASIAHELNQPLTAIMANAQAAKRLMNAPKPDYVEVEACLADIISDDSRAAEVIRRMRRLLTKSDFVSLPISLNDLVTMTIGLVANDALLHATALEFKPAPALPVIYGDLVQIQQVILNLLANAITAAAAGSCPVRVVSVWTQVVSPLHVELGVQDSGEGIREEDLHRLFEPFFTRKADGLGMGLAISRTIVEAHGGDLRAENAPKGGAIFRVHLRTDQPTT
jgi:signal transduction histidine kinase